MRIGFDAWGLSGTTLFTGMGQYAQHLISGLATIGGVEVVAYGAPGEPRPAWLPDVVAWRAPSTRAPQKLGAIATRLWTLRRAGAADHLDLFHAPATHVRASMPPVPGMDCPVITTVHDVIPLTLYGTDLPWRLRAFYRWNLRRAIRSARVITVSEDSRKQITTVTSATESRIEVIPNGVAFAPNPDPSPLLTLGLAKPYVLFAGSFEPRKNLRRALVAFDAVARRELHHSFVAIVDAGSGHAAAIEEFVAMLECAPRVRLAHGLDDATIRSLYTHAEMLLFPSLAEGFGLPPLQAAACGVPVVASDLPAIREVLGDAAVYFNPSNEGEIAASIREVLGSSDRRRGLVAAGAERARLWTWTRCVARHLEVYRDVYEKGAKP